MAVYDGTTTLLTAPALQEFGAGVLMLLSLVLVLEVYPRL
jgi:hypothetical protein